MEESLLMTDEKQIITRESQFEGKRAARQLAAAASFEEKYEKLVALQRIAFVLAEQKGTPAKKPWPIPGKEYTP